MVGYLLQKKYPHVSIGRALMMIDGIILSTSIFVFGNVDAALFGLISLYAQTKVIDMIIYGNDAGSEASIVTKYPQKIAERVIKEIDPYGNAASGQGRLQRRGHDGGFMYRPQNGVQSFKTYYCGDG